MGFYLPGIGEAIGGALRVQRQNELWTKAQDILKDETKPMADRLQLVGAAYPELANSEEFQKRAEMARQYDADKMARAKFDREEAAAASAQRFREKLQTIPEDQRRAYMLANPDVAADALPELLKQYQGEVKAAEEDANWNERFQLQEQGKNQRNAATNQATVTAQQLALDKEYRAGVASGAVDPATGQVIPYAQRQEAEQARTVETARLKAEQAAGIEKTSLNEKRTQVDANIEAGIDAVISNIETEGGVGWSGADFGEREALRKTLGLALAQRENPGRPPTDADVAVAMERVPDMTTFVSAEEAKSALKTLKKTFRGFTPALPEGFVIE